MRRLYVETSVVSFLTSRPSRDLLLAANQQVTYEWWERRSGSFELYISDVVLDDAREGDPEAAARRLAVVQPLRVLATTDDALRLARVLLERSPLPPTAGVDALHIAVACVHGMDYLMSWNCRHIANAAIHSVVADICRDFGYEPPIICTPLQLLE
jgi:hypothetical protein